MGREARYCISRDANIPDEDRYRPLSSDNMFVRYSGMPDQTHYTYQELLKEMLSLIGRIALDDDSDVEELPQCLRSYAILLAEMQEDDVVHIINN
jgi:hypothetical protein